MEQLIACAELLGVSVTHETMEDRDGAYYDDLKIIVIDPRLSPLEEKFTLAHEIGHAYFRHRKSGPEEEMLADEVAAAILVSPREYESLSHLSDSEQFIAQELGVSSRAIEAFQRALTKGSLVSRVRSEVLSPAVVPPDWALTWCFS